jgi:hypothetical protein
MISDEGEYACEARILSRGGLPYRDAYDQKPPMVFFLYQAAFRLFGERPGSARRLALIFSWAAIAALFALVPPGWGRPARWSAAACFASAATLPVGDLGFAANTEVFLCGFLACSALCARLSWERGSLPWAATAGALAGAAFTTKQTALWSAAAFAAALAWGTPRPRRLAAALSFSAGLCIVPAAFLSYFALRGGLRDLIEQAFLRNMDYAALLASPEAAAVQGAWFLKILLPLLLQGTWPMILLAAWGLAGTRAGPDNRLETLAALWLGASILGALTGLFLFPHYFLAAAPPLALCAALGVRRAGTRGWAAAALAAALPAAAFARLYFLDPPETVARKLLFPNPLYESLAVADFIRERSSPDEAVYVFGSEPQIYFYADRPPATRHIYVYPLTLFPRGGAAAEAEISRLAKFPPRFIVYSTFQASTLIATRAGAALARSLADLLETDYLYRGHAAAAPSGPEISLQAPPGTPPDWGKTNALLVFERKR